MILDQQDKGREVTPLIELKEIVFGAEGLVRLDMAAFCNATGLSLEEVETCLAVRLLKPRKKAFSIVNSRNRPSYYKQSLEMSVSTIKK